MADLFVCLNHYHVFFSYCLIQMKKEQGIKTQNILIVPEDISYDLSGDDTEVYKYIFYMDTLRKRLKGRLSYNNFVFAHSRIGKLIGNREFGHVYIYNDKELITEAILYHIKSREITLIEEGLALYVDKGLPIKNVMLKKYLYKVIGSRYICGAMGTDKRITSVFVENAEEYRKLEKAKTQKVLPLKKKRVISKARCFNFLQKTGVNETVLQKADVILLGQNLENSRLSEVEKQAYQILFDVIPENLFTMIKPHNGERIEKYNCLLNGQVAVIRGVGGEVPIECLAGLANAKSVISMYSSGLGNYKRLNPNVTAVALFRVKEINKFENMRERLDKLIPVFQESGVLLPETKEELKAILNSIDVYREKKS